MTEQATLPGSRYDSTNPVLLNLQSPTGVPRSSRLTSVTDPIGGVPRVADQLAHFWEGLYDLSPESHLSRFLKALLGDSGMGALTKQYTVTRLHSVVMTTRYHDLDRLYGGLLGMRRMASESLGINAYVDDATPEEWEVIDARDAAYRSRVETFSRAMTQGATAEGMAALAQAVTGVECRVHESYLDVDDEFSTPTPAPPTGRSYGDVQRDFGYYGAMNRGTYADIEGGFAVFGGSGDSDSNRSEFIVSPKRMLSLEETYELSLVLRRFKPAGALLRISPLGVPVHRPVIPRHVYADSVHWEVETKVAPNKDVESAYSRSEGPGVPVSQPRTAFSGYQGEAWSYNADVSSVFSYTVGTDGAVSDRYNYQRVMVHDTPHDYVPAEALASQQSILSGRLVSDGVASASPFSSERGVVYK